jgi:hypothetical protein
VEAKDLDAGAFQETVVNDDRVWLVEFYSPMCGSCSEFAPTWNKIETAMKSIATGTQLIACVELSRLVMYFILFTGKINIDDQAGMKLADSLGVLEEGLPNIRLFASRDKGTSILQGLYMGLYMPFFVSNVYD